MKLQKILVILFFSMTLGWPIQVIAQSISDVDGNLYTSVKINQQTWLGQNLNVSHFRNGDPIPQVSSDEEWEKAGAEQKPVWCHYENSDEHGKTYGKLYNWYAVHDERGLAPKGYHIPTDQDWNALSVYLGGGEKAGGKLKEKGTAHWKSPNSDATNSSGWNGLPGGLNYSFGTFVDVENTGYWWTSVENGEVTANVYSLSFKNSTLADLFLNKGVGLSVRCIRD
jgi:uncharacterized protein (TIGR02145 family)